MLLEKTLVKASSDADLFNTFVLTETGVSYWAFMYRGNPVFGGVSYRGYWIKDRGNLATSDRTLYLYKVKVT